ncbi:MAG: stress response translation initiation inhibitor YciH [Candidatus Woesearchaeota archaeon]|nr:stress response translation initiation inhibitor YciH [Nanoarchaeota archaeon]USN44851.1 MAG: stress response translation initiation inhibitor YciH [Candidatus Woesearchaeota archaeon]
MFEGLPDELQEFLDDSSKKESALVEIKVERRKYGKLWAIISGVDIDSNELKDLLKKIKNKLACGGTIKGKSIEILYGRVEKNKDLISILMEEGYSRDSIHISGK